MAGNGRSLGRTLAGRRWVMRTRWAQHPSYLAYSRLRHPLLVARPETELVIEGFPRSANTFSTVAFQFSQPRPVRLAHHLHVPAQITAGARMGTPVLVLVRHPRDCAVSVAIRSPHVSLRQAVDAHRRFHEAVLPYRDACHVALFEDVVRDFGRVVAGLNARFGTAYELFDHTPENVRRVYALIEERARQPAHFRTVEAYLAGVAPLSRLESARAEGAASESGRVLPEHRVARPSPERRNLQGQLAERYEEPDLARVRERAEAAYRRFAFGP
jgi:hypothetical protein